MLKTDVLSNIFVETMINIFQDSLMNRKLFCNIINVFFLCATFDQFNAFLMHSE